MEALAALFQETGHAHHAAFLETDGEDPEWPRWYADYLHPRIGALLDNELTTSRIVDLLQSADREVVGSGDGIAWFDAYAEYFRHHA